MSMILEEGAPILPTGLLPDVLDVLLVSSFIHHNLQLE
jgi:hypothetical protein